MVGLRVRPSTCKPHSTTKPTGTHTTPCPHSCRDLPKPTTAQAGVHGLRTPFRGGTLRDLALRALQISHGGLERRGRSEAGFLNALQAIAESGMTPADALLEAYQGRWGGSVDPIYDELAY